MEAWKSLKFHIGRTTKTNKNQLNQPKLIEFNHQAAFKKFLPTNNPHVLRIIIFMSTLLIIMNDMKLIAIDLLI